MIESEFDAAVDMIRTGSAAQPIQRLVEIAAHVARAPIAYLIVRSGTTERVLMSHGISHIAYGKAMPFEPHTGFLYDQALVIDDLSRDARTRGDHLVASEAGWLWLAAVPLPLPTLSYRVAIVCADSRREVVRTRDVLERLQRLAAVLADEFQLLGMLAQPQHRAPLEQTAAPAGEPRIPVDAESLGVTTDFLLSTLIEQRRLLHRGKLSYHAAARWRLPIKAHQIAALRALKRDLPTGFVQTVADRLSSTADALWGTAFSTIVPVPCGNSGPNCLSHQLAGAVAQRLGHPMHEAFAPIAVNGSSHPRRNGTRPTMTLIDRPTQPVLLIDDVATSGAHIEEATRLLRDAGVTTFPLVWIAG